VSATRGPGGRATCKHDQLPVVWHHSPFTAGAVCMQRCALQFTTAGRPLHLHGAAMQSACDCLQPTIVQQVCDSCARRVRIVRRYCFWWGVKCNSRNQVEQLDLSQPEKDGLRLTGRLPPGYLLRDLPALRIFYAANNSLAGERVCCAVLCCAVLCCAVLCCAVLCCMCCAVLCQGHPCSPVIAPYP
jgi:hypothetical protein